MKRPHDDVSKEDNRGTPAPKTQWLRCPRCGRWVTLGHVSNAVVLNTVQFVSGYKGNTMMHLSEAKGIRFASA